MPTIDITDQAPFTVQDFQTTDATPVLIPLVTLSSNGDRAMIPEMHVIGLTLDGVVGNTSLRGFSVVRTAGILVLRTLFDLNQSFGIGGLGIVTAVSGNDLRLTCTGLVLTTINWTVYYQLIRRPPQ